MLSASQRRGPVGGQRSPSQVHCGYYQRWLAALERLVVDKGALALGRARCCTSPESTRRSLHVVARVCRALTRRFRLHLLAVLMPGWLVKFLRMQGLHRPGVRRHPVRARQSRRGFRDQTRRSTRGDPATRGKVRRSSVAMAKRAPNAARGEGAASTSTRSSSTEELWGDDAEPGTAVRIDLFESYIGRCLTHNPAKDRRPRGDLDREGHDRRETVERIISYFEARVGPMVGARVVARALGRSGFVSGVLPSDRAIAELGIGGLQSEQRGRVENTPRVHNVIVCTLCSCYPWAVLGLPPAW